MRVHDGGDGAVVDVTVAFGDVFNCGDSFFLSLVREHGSKCAVADDTDMRQFGAVLFVDYHATFIVDVEADVLEAEAGGVGAAADRYEDYVCVQLRRC